MKNLKSPPNNIEYEQAFLSCIILDPGMNILNDAIAAGIGQDAFYNPLNRRIWLAMQKILRRGEVGHFDELVIRDELNKDDPNQQVSYADVSSVLGKCETTFQAPQYIARLLELWQRRQIRELGIKLFEKCDEECLEALVQITDKSLEAISTSKKRDDTCTPKALAKTAHDVFESRRANKGRKGISTGIPFLDRTLKGMAPGELVLLAARPSVGKTAFALQILQATAIQAKQMTLVFSMEMGRESLSQRILQGMTGIDSSVINNNLLSPYQLKAKEQAIQDIEQGKFMILDGSNYTVSDIRIRAKRYQLDPPELIIIDYCQLIKASDPKALREQQVADISRSLKTLAKELHIPILLLCQLNREQFDEKEGPKLNQLRESGQLEQDADAILFLWQSDKNDPTKVSCNIAKNRNGETDIAVFHYNKMNQQFSEIRKDETYARQSA
jgi:replicative DNA helicase